MNTEKFSRNEMNRRQNLKGKKNETTQTEINNNEQENLLQNQV